jgi:hypothetical protein
MRVRLIGENARYLARSWHKHGMVDHSDDEETVELYPKLNSLGGDALYESYLSPGRAFLGSCAGQEPTSWIFAYDDTVPGSNQFSPLADGARYTASG